MSVCPLTSSSLSLCGFFHHSLCFSNSPDPILSLYIISLSPLSYVSSFSPPPPPPPPLSISPLPSSLKNRALNFTRHIIVSPGDVGNRIDGEKAQSSFPSFDLFLDRSAWFGCCCHTLHTAWHLPSPFHHRLHPPGHAVIHDCRPCCCCCYYYYYYYY